MPPESSHPPTLNSSLLTSRLVLDIKPAKEIDIMSTNHPSLERAKTVVSHQRRNVLHSPAVRTTGTVTDLMLLWKENKDVIWSDQYICIVTHAVALNIPASSTKLRTRRACHCCFCARLNERSRLLEYAGSTLLRMWKELDVCPRVSLSSSISAGRLESLEIPRRVP